jgi:hypothetical protein
VAESPLVGVVIVKAEDTVSVAELEVVVAVVPFFVLVTTTEKDPESEVAVGLIV